MKYFHLVIFSALCVACATARQATPSERLHTETRIETVFQTDTIQIEIPRIVEKIVTKDTLSILENEYALSEASVSDGFLSHTLETKPIQHPVKIQKETVYRDSIIFNDKIIVETVEVEKPLTGWQNIKMKTGGFALGLLLIAIVCIILYFVKHLNLKAL